MSHTTEVIAATGKFISDLMNEDYIAENVDASTFIPEVMDRLIQLVQVVGDLELAKQRLEQELKEELEEKEEEEDEDDDKPVTHHDPPIGQGGRNSIRQHRVILENIELDDNGALDEPEPPEPDTLKEDVVPPKKTFGPKKRKGWFSW